MNAPHRPFIPYARHNLDKDDIEAVLHVLRGDWLTTGPEVEAFEAALAAATEARHAIACANGTAALHLAARALAIGEGDVVIVPSITFLATANAPALTGAEIVFADVDPDTGLMGPDHLEAALARAPPDRVAAVFNVHFAGQPGPLEKIAAIARPQGIAVVEDAAHALGATYAPPGRGAAPIGACMHADVTTFSFHPVKIATMGEGGAVTTRREDLAEFMRRDRSHGMTRDARGFRNEALAFGPDGKPNPWYYELTEPGLNYRATDIQCALGRSQLAKLGMFIAHRQHLAACYDKLLAPLAPLVTPLRRLPGARSAWHLYVVRIDFEAAGVSRAEVMTRLQAKGIGTQVHYIPVHRQPYYRRRNPSLALPGADAFYGRALSLPMWTGLMPSDCARVVDGLRQALAL